METKPQPEFLHLKPIPDEAIKRTSFGIVASLDIFFDKYLYGREVKVPPGGMWPLGRQYNEGPPGFYFLGSDYPLKIHSFASPPAQGAALVVRPIPEILKEVQKRCCEGRVGGFRVIPWAHTGHALVCASDAVHIANPWLGFVPLGSIPDLTAATVAVWDGGVVP